MFGNAFKKIFMILFVLALLLGLGAGVYFGVIPALRYDVWRVEPDEQVSSADTPIATTTPLATEAATAEPTATPELAPATAEEWVERYMTTMSTQEKLGQLVMFGCSGTTEAEEPFRAIWNS